MRAAGGLGEDAHRPGPQPGGDALGELIAVGGAGTTAVREPPLARAPDEADRLYQYFTACCREKGIATETGRFAADMQVSLVNDGPVTFWLQV